MKIRMYAKFAMPCYKSPIVVTHDTIIPDGLNKEAKQGQKQRAERFFEEIIKRFYAGATSIKFSCEDIRNETTESESVKRIRRWLSEGTVIRDNSSWEFTHSTMMESSKLLFINSVKCFNGWLINESSYQRNGRIHYETKACIPFIMDRLSSCLLKQARKTHDKKATGKRA